MEIKGKNVLITGGAVRIGAVLCEAFAEAGANVLVHYNRSEQAAIKLQEKIVAKYKVDCRTIQLDLSKIEEIRKVFNNECPVDILINNASVFIRQLLANESSSDEERQFTINFRAPAELMKVFQTQCSGPGCIVNLLDQRISGVDAESGSYALSKKCLADLTMAAAKQWAPEIRVNGIAPGPVLPPVGLNGEGMTVELENVPLRHPVNLADLAQSCLFLVENESITGHILYVDCGQHLT